MVLTLPWDVERNVGSARLTWLQSVDNFGGSEKQIGSMVASVKASPSILLSASQDIFWWKCCFRFGCFSSFLAVYFWFCSKKDGREAVVVGWGDGGGGSVTCSRKWVIMIRSIWDSPQAPSHNLNATAAVPDFTRRVELQHASGHFIRRSTPYTWELNWRWLIIVPTDIGR